MTSKSSPEPNQPGMISDVSRPGATLPSSSARPVVPSREVVRDPMTVDETTEGGDVVSSESDTPSPAQHHAMRIEPLKQSDIDENDMEPDSSLTTSEADDVEEKPVETPKTSPANESDEDLEATNEEATKLTAKKDAQLEAEKALAYETETDALIASKQYLLPISASDRKRRGVGLAIVFIVLAVAGGAAYYILVFNKA